MHCCGDDDDNFKEIKKESLKKSKTKRKKIEIGKEEKKRKTIRYIKKR